MSALPNSMVLLEAISSEGRHVQTEVKKSLPNSCDLAPASDRLKHLKDALEKYRNPPDPPVEIAEYATSDFRQWWTRLGVAFESFTGPQTECAFYFGALIGKRPSISGRIHEQPQFKPKIYRSIDFTFSDARAREYFRGTRIHACLHKMPIHGKITFGEGRKWFSILERPHSRSSPGTPTTL